MRLLVFHNNQNNGDKDDDMSNAHKWITSKLDLFKDFKQIKILDAFRALA
jgi:hypothetical protein